MEKETLYLIWSNQHHAWWKAHSRGYTTHRKDAGLYSYDDAIEICKGANIMEKDIPDEAMVPIEVCAECLGTGVVVTDEDDGEGHIMRGVGTRKCLCQTKDETDY